MNHVQTVDTNSIRVRNRVRRDLGNLDSLKESMRKNGLLNPITVTKDFSLVAGQRRLESARELGWRQIQCVVIDIEDQETLLQLELDENSARKDFSSDEMADALLRLDRLMNPPWTKRLSRWFKRVMKRIGRFLRNPFRTRSDR